MSIRIRVVDGVMVALCAARSMPKEGDVYLDDAAHHALSQKFLADFASEGIVTGNVADPRVDAIREREESNNPNRTSWDATFGPTPTIAAFLWSADRIEEARGLLFTFTGIAGIDPRALKDRIVYINNYAYLVLSVETYAIYDATGTNFGLLVERPRQVDLFGVKPLEITPASDIPCGE